MQVQVQVQVQVRVQVRVVGGACRGAAFTGGRQTEGAGWGGQESREGKHAKQLIDYWGGVG